MDKPLWPLRPGIRISRAKAGSSGPMAEIVYDSLQYLTDEDTRAMSVYLRVSPKAHRLSRQ